MGALPRDERRLSRPSHAGVDRDPLWRFYPRICRCPPGARRSRLADARKGGSGQRRPRRGVPKVIRPRRASSRAVRQVALPHGDRRLRPFARHERAYWRRPPTPDLRDARARFARGRARALRHVLPNALLPVITNSGVLVGYMFTSAVLVEAVFSWPGVGTMMIKAVEGRDYPTLQAGAFVVASVFVLINWVVDALYGLIDPR